MIIIGNQEMIVAFKWQCFPIETKELLLNYVSNEN